MSMTGLINTPGYYYSIAYFLATFVIACTNRKRRYGKINWVIHGIFFFLLVGFMALTDGVRQMLFLPSMMVSLSLIFLYLYGMCDFGWKESGYYCVRAVITGEFAASICWQIYFYLTEMGKTSGSEVWKWGELMIVYFLFFLGFYFMEKHLQKEVDNLNITTRELVTVMIVAIAVFVVSNVSYLDQDALFGSRFAGEMFAIRTLVDLSGMAVLYAYHIQVRELQMQFEVHALQNILETQYKNYQLSQESMELVNQKYHDLKHQIAILKMEADSEKAKKYLNQMEEEIQFYEAQNKTGNHVLDAVLTSKSLYCQKHGIRLTCVVDGQLLNFMADMDISALFGNMLDNAMESVQKLEDPEKRLIHLSVAKQKQFLRIRIENYCEENLVFQNGLPVTTKKDRRLHGYGMKSIESTVKKYGGSVKAGIRERWFELRILIPI